MIHTPRLQNGKKEGRIITNSSPFCFKRVIFYTAHKVIFNSALQEDHDTERRASGPINKATWIRMKITNINLFLSHLEYQHSQINKPVWQHRTAANLRPRLFLPNGFRNGAAKQIIKPMMRSAWTSEVRWFNRKTACLSGSFTLAASTATVALP